MRSVDLQYEDRVLLTHKGVFEETIGHMKEEGISLAGVVHEYTNPATGKDYLIFR